MVYIESAIGMLSKIMIIIDFMLVKSFVNFNSLPLNKMANYRDQLLVLFFTRMANMTGSDSFAS